MQWLLDRFAAAPERTAFIHEGRRVGYGEVVEAVAVFRDQIRKAGVKPGARVAVLADYSPEVFAFLLALALEAAVAIPLSRAAVVEEEAALAISGCDLFAAFDMENRRPDIRRHAVAAEHQLLEALKAQGRPGLILFSSGSSGQPKARSRSPRPSRRGAACGLPASSPQMETGFRRRSAASVVSAMSRSTAGCKGS